MQSIKPLAGQSNYDISLQSVGCFDNMIKFLSNNSIQSTAQIVRKECFFDETLKNINTNNINIAYATSNKIVSVSGVYGSSYGGAYG